MVEPTLVILAAGLSSRYGGLKQIDPVGNNGESLIDFSMYDAYQAGFKKMVLVIRREHEALFDELVLDNIRPFIDVTYAYQNVKDLPEPFVCPAARVKPWGTVQALLSTKNLVDGPFMLINADDFYGRESFQIMYDFLKDQADDHNFGMIGYQLVKTLTDNGAVTRAICTQDEKGNLSSITETRNLIRQDGHAFQIQEDKSLREMEDGLSSMNFFGFTPAVYSYMEKYFCNFLEKNVNVDKSEFILSTALSQLIKETDINVKVLSSDAEWFGVTYPKDKEEVKFKLQQYKDQDIYPFDLWD